MSIGLQAEVTNRDLTLVGDMRGHPSDELQIVHPLHLFGFFPMPVRNLALFSEKESRSSERSGLIMYFPTRSASFLV
jgi:hypothetical protein